MSAEPPVINPAPEHARDDAATATPAPGPVTSLHDPRVIQILATEHWSLLAGRALAYNEAFIRGGMFLTFLSMSFVGLALLAQAMSFSEQFMIVSALVLTFDFVMGLLTYGRINGAAVDDLRAVHAMARIRHAYGEIAPIAMPFFSSPTHDDVDSVMTVYASAPSSTVASIFYGLSTSQGMIGLITTMVGGLLAAVTALILDLSGEVAVLLGLLTSFVVLLTLVVLTFRGVTREQAALEVRFPAPTPSGAARDSFDEPEAVD